MFSRYLSLPIVITDFILLALLDSLIDSRSIVTHNMSQAARLSDNSMFMYLGELVEYGTTKQMFTKPKDKRTEDYLTGVFS